MFILYYSYQQRIDANYHAKLAYVMNTSLDDDKTLMSTSFNPPFGNAASQQLHFVVDATTMPLKSVVNAQIVCMYLNMIIMVWVLLSSSCQAFGRVTMLRRLCRRTDVIFSARDYRKLSGFCLNMSDDNSKTNRGDSNITSAQRLLDLAFQRADRTLTTVLDSKSAQQTSSRVDSTSDINFNKKNKQVYMDKRTYKSQPAVTGTALAHLLWKSTLRPGVDSAIDATCGNGHDSLAIANILFSREIDFCEGEVSSKSDGDSGTIESELLCIDIQDIAVERTTSMLREKIPKDTIFNRINVVQRSHAPLPTNLLSSTENIGLIVYNLGWLPGAGPKIDDSSEKVATQLHSTLSSMSDAALALRVGGLLSVMTYPGTCENEADAVAAFAEALAMFTTKNPGGWQKGVNEIQSKDVREVVNVAATKVYENGMKGQAWRVFDHKPLGRPSSPILVTAMRIK